MMGFFTKLEKVSEKHVEGFFKNRFPEHIHPSEIGRLLGKEMRNNKTTGSDSNLVPNEFTVFLGQEDWRAIDSLNDSLSQEVEKFVRKKAGEKGYKMSGHLKVSFALDDSLSLGDIAIESCFSANLPEIACSESIRGPKPSEFTMIVDKEQFYHRLTDEEKSHTQTRIKRDDLPRAFLVQKFNEREGVSFPIGRQTLVMGRRKSNVICLEDTNISRVHASIDCLEECYFVCDLGSTNGTFVNGFRVTKKKLSEGDQIRIGTSVLEFRMV
jgi:hypothetical protein